MPSYARPIDLRNALLCAAAITFAFLIVNPFVNMPFDDDWSYSFTVRQFLATGNITYNGWSAPLIITHTLWGAMFSKFFGYSFVTLRSARFHWTSAQPFFLISWPAVQISARPPPFVFH